MSDSYILAPWQHLATHRLHLLLNARRGLFCNMKHGRFEVLEDYHLRCA